MSTEGAVKIPRCFRKTQSRDLRMDSIRWWQVTIIKKAAFTALDFATAKNM
jgi:hypothetical protein